jgi:hypothetical protein
MAEGLCTKVEYFEIEFFLRFAIDLFLAFLSLFSSNFHLETSICKLDLVVYGIVNPGPVREHWARGHCSHMPRTWPAPVLPIMIHV